MNFERVHSPRFTLACASGMLRQSASSMAIVCSVADMMFAVGALMTRMPRAVQASTSTLSSPTPARPMMRSRVPGVHQLRRDRGAAARDERVGLRDRVEQLLAFEAGPVVELDVLRCAQDLQAGFGEGVGDEGAEHAREYYNRAPVRRIALCCCSSSLRCDPRARRGRTPCADWMDALNALDEARIVDAFAEDATAFFPMVKAERLDGKAAIAAVFRDYFTANTKKTNIVPEDLRVQQSGDIAVITFNVHNPSAVSRRTFVWRRDGARGGSCTCTLRTSKGGAVGSQPTWHSG